MIVAFSDSGLARDFFYNTLNIRADSFEESCRKEVLRCDASALDAEAATAASKVKSAGTPKGRKGGLKGPPRLKITMAFFIANRNFGCLDAVVALQARQRRSHQTRAWGVSATWVQDWMSMLCQDFCHLAWQL